jgi:hypothetical protein
MRTSITVAPASKLFSTSSFTAVAKLRTTWWEDITITAYVSTGFSILGKILCQVNELENTNSEIQSSNLTRADLMYNIFIYGFNPSLFPFWRWKFHQRSLMWPLNN